MACVLFKNWFPILVVVAYLFAPLPNLLCAACGRGYEDNKARAFKDAGFFLTGIFVVSGLALPSVLAHLTIIKTTALFLGLAGGLIVYGTILTYLHCFHGKKRDDDFM
eukprot:CAMPEP_0168539448 /NCGR_PEP_ID=MMETSP0405-20121227/21835_1 /TAXON_ID=498012 /ORGANISM="Trichosphaerium sp, Strain Am-I-7 wt" /LENGTH=107 /DNA_ID=CAMNT_0008569015 /DNA_START=54 /DNA_END=377 /DNA_ORIENTATION=+